MKKLVAIFLAISVSACERIEQRNAQSEAVAKFEGRWTNAGRSGPVQAYRDPGIEPFEFWVPDHFDVRIEDGYGMHIEWSSPETHTVPHLWCEFRDDLSPLRAQSHKDGVAFFGDGYGVLFLDPAHNEAYFVVWEESDFGSERRYGPFTKTTKANKTE
jgi:hypothetical protein